MYVRGGGAWGSAVASVCFERLWQQGEFTKYIVVVDVFLFYVQDKHLRSCRDGQLT